MAQEDGPSIDNMPCFRQLARRPPLCLRPEESLDPAEQQFDPRTFGLDQDPFGASLDPSFLYTNAERRALYSSLLNSIRANCGLFLMTGEGGAGKTALLARLAQELRAADCLVISNYRAGLGFGDLASLLSAELGVPDPAGDDPQRLACIRKSIAEHGEAQRAVVLLIDDAQNLGGDVVTRLHLLTQAPDALRLVLVGRPVVRRRLDLPVLASLAGTLVLHRELVPLSDDDVASLVWHRLRRAGHRGIDLFSDGAVAAIVHHARGLPGRAIFLSARALRLASAADQLIVTDELVERAASELHECSAVFLAPPDEHRPFRTSYLQLAGAVLVGLGVFSTAAVALVAGMPVAGSWASIGQTISSSIPTRVLPPKRESSDMRADYESGRDVRRPSPTDEAAPTPLAQSSRGMDAEAAAPNSLPLLGLAEEPAAGQPEAVKPVAAPPIDEGVAAKSDPFEAASTTDAEPNAGPLEAVGDAAAGDETGLARRDEPTGLGDAPDPLLSVIPSESETVAAPRETNDDVPPAASAEGGSGDADDVPETSESNASRPEAVLPQPESPVAAQRDETEEVLRLLAARGERQVAAGRLASPPADNATATYRQILAIAPKDAAGPLLLESIRSIYRERARMAQRDGNSAEAQRLYELAVDPAATVAETSGAVGPPSESSTVAPSYDAAASAGDVPQPTPLKETVPISKQMIGTLMRRGREMLAVGDISAARLLYERAAVAGDAQAATEAGKTYDPVFLREIAARGVPPRPERAVEWYRKAIAAGDAEAEARLTKLKAAAGE